MSEKGQYPHLLEQELRLYRLMGDKFVNKAKDLPKGAVDLVIAALEDQGNVISNITYLSHMCMGLGPVFPDNRVYF